MEGKPLIPLEELNSKAQDVIVDLAKKAGESDGFIFFVGRISNGKDIDFNYIREKFSIDDAVTAVKAFRKHVLDDMANEVTGG